MSATDDKIIDRVEHGVLDEHHRQFHLLQRSEYDATIILLRTFARVMRHVRAGHFGNETESAKLDTLNKGLRGLGHCLRWIKDCCPSKLIVATPAAIKGHAEAFALLRWGATYDPLWNQHSAWRGKKATGEANESTKSITFRSNIDVDPHFFCSQIEAKKGDDERLSRDRPDQKLDQLWDEWFAAVKSPGLRLPFDDETFTTSGAIDIAVEWMGRSCVPELSDATSLVGCTIGELRRVLAAIYVYSRFATKLEDHTDENPERGLVMEPLVVSRPRPDMLGWLAGLSGVPITNVDAIVSALTFDPKHPHVTLGEQPFVATADGGMHFLPRMIVRLDMPRVLIGVLNTMKEPHTRERGVVLCVEEKPLYDRLVGEIEDTGVTVICNELGRSGLPEVQIAEKRSYRLPDDQIITPDIVMVVSNREVLVVDVKYATPPFGPLDVRHDIKEVEKWRRRMSEYVEAFARHPEILAQRFEVEPNEGMTVRGLILLRWPFPVPVEFEPPVYAVDWPSLHEHLRNEPPDSIQNLVEWIRDRPDLTVPAKLDWTEKTVVAADWTYRYFVLMPSAPAPSKS